MTSRITKYCYDAMGRLTQATVGASIYNYGWDKNSNRITDEAGAHTFNDGDQLIDPGNVYDADGNQTASTAYPNASYNGIDQTISITKAGQAAVPFDYAGMGQSERISAGATTTKNGVLGKQIETTGGQSIGYLHDAYGGLVYQDGPGGDDYYYYFDGLGSVIGMTDASGNHRAKYSYDPFGAHATETAVNGSLPANPWRWMGGYLDATTGLYHFGERYYDPTLGRFLQVDPVAGGSCNAYDYACGDPVNGSDLSGTFSCTANRVCRGFRNWPTNAAGRVWGGLADLVGGKANGCGTPGTKCISGSPLLVPWADAGTLGNTIVCRRQCSSTLVRHESVHVRQFDRGGITFPFQYGWETLSNGISCDNKYESPAYNAGGPGTC